MHTTTLRSFRGSGRVVHSPVAIIELPRYNILFEEYQLNNIVRGNHLSMPPIPAKRRGPGRPPLAAGSGRSVRSAGGRGGGGRSGRGGRGLLLRPPPRPAGVAGKTSIGDNPNLEHATSDSEESSEDLLGANNNNDGSNSSLSKSCMTPLLSRCFYRRKIPNDHIITH